MNTTLFGTDGIRGTVGTSFFTADNLVKLGDALSSWIEHKYGTSSIVLLGHDTRQSASFIKMTLISRLLLKGISVYDAGVLPTPALFSLMEAHPDICCTLVISASHNPYEDNGIKVISTGNGKISLADEQAITTFYYSPLSGPNYHALGNYISYKCAQQEYIDFVSSHFSLLNLDGFSIVLDCAHGAAYKVAPILFEALGATIIPLHTEPNGKNINEKCGALDCTALQKAVVENNAHIGFAFDGDADRVIAVNNKGIIKDGDEILALLASDERYKQSNSIVGTVMSNKGFEVYLKSIGKSLIRVPVGDKYVAQKMQELNCLLGGEQSGHIMLGDYLPTGDGIVTALKIMQVIIASNNLEMKTFTRFPQVLINVVVNHKENLDESPLSDIIKEYQDKLKDGRLLVRYSGTELLLRVMVEDQEYEHAQIVCAQLAKCLQGELGN